MKKVSIAVCFCLVLILGIFSGCQEEQAGITTFKGITLQSSIVEFVNASLEFNYDNQNRIDSVTVKYLFHNIAKRSVVAKITVEFYDNENNLLFAGGPTGTITLPEDYTEQGFAPGVNIVTYDGENAPRVHHAIIIVVDSQ